MSRNGLKLAPKLAKICPWSPEASREALGVAKRLKKIIFYAPFWRSFWHVLGYSETELFWPRLLELPRAAFGGPGEPQAPFWLHFGSMFGAILGPESKEGEKVKIELSLRRELNFGGPGRPRKR